MPYKYYYEKLTGTGKYSKFSETPSNLEIIRNAHMSVIRGGQRHKFCFECSRLFGTTREAQAIKDGRHKEFLKSIEGGYDNKYRKLRGIGEYSKRKNDTQTKWEQSTISDYVRNAHEQQKTSDKGEYP